MLALRPSTARARAVPAPRPPGSPRVLRIRRPATRGAMADPQSSARGRDAEEDGRLLARLRAGEPRAFEDLVRRHGGRLLAVARRMLRDEEEARDCVQEAFLSAHRALGEFEGRARLGTWLHRIVTNAALMKLRSRARRPEQSIEEHLPRYDDYGFLIGPEDTTPLGADELLAREGVAARVREAIDRLPESYRTVLMLRDIEELDTEETARLLDITPGAAKVRLHRARTALKSMLQDVFREET